MTTMKNTVLWDVTPCTLVNIYLCFGGTIYLYLHGIRVNQAKKKWCVSMEWRDRTIDETKGLSIMVKRYEILKTMFPRAEGKGGTW